MPKPAEKKASNAAPYPDADPNPDFVAIEKEVLAFWEKEKVFEASVANRPEKNKDGATNAYVFYDGPPFANGLPHYGHLLTGYVKDLIARYQTMKGRRVERRFGWDCHGLPAEMAAEKELGISGRQQIMEYGIGKFNDYCRTSVMRYTKEWKAYVDRQARWVDFEHDYKTMDTSFMESVLWAFKQLYDKGLIYETYRVVPYSWAAETVLSNFETRLDNATRDREDKAITVAFELNERPEGAPEADKYYVLAWTTTPWTLPSNLALAAGKKLDYVAIPFDDGDCLICSINYLPALLKNLGVDSVKVFKSGSRYLSEIKGGVDIKYVNLLEKCLEQNVFNGKNLLNLTYKPLFPYFEDQPNAFRILDGSEFITEGEGTGVVHMAPAFGEDDQRTCEDAGIEMVNPVDEKGRYTDEIFDLCSDSSPLVGERLSASPQDAARSVGGASATQEIPPHDSLRSSAPPQGGSGDSRVLQLRGLNVIAETKLKDPSEPYTDQQMQKFGLANLRIIRWLKDHGQLIKEDVITHAYPHCWRTDTPIIYRAVPSWYVQVSAFKDRAVALNQNINWIPEHVRDGAMGNMLKTAPDWSISRNRFWGCPIPIWKSDNPDNKKLYVFGSIQELEKFFGKKVTDLHRPFIDELAAPDPENPKYTLRRVEEVLDCWFESGSMPYAQLHYPFENKDRFEANYPADFITEYIGQTRGWFNTLIMLATGLSECGIPAFKDKHPFQNCICHGVVIDEESGLKYSKRLKNYQDPMEVFDQYGADALRWLMVSSPVMRGADLGVDPEGKFIRDVVRLNIKPIWSAYTFFTMYTNADGIKAEFSTESENLMDRYILAKCREMITGVEQSLDAYDTPGATEAITKFVEVLNNWYIRRNKERFWKSEHDTDKLTAYNTLYTVLHILCRAAAPLLPLTAEKIFRALVGVSVKNSVHLQDFPSDFLAGHSKNETLMHTMDRVRDICNAAHAIRNVENIRVRQPLASLTCYRASIEGDRDYFSSLIADETNVKQVRFEEELEKVANFKLKVNFPVAGKRLGAKMKEVGTAAKSGKWEKKSDGAIVVGGEKLETNEYELLLESKIAKGAQALASNDGLVVLDLTLTPELEAEGIARDVVRMIQQARKDAGLNVSDHIALTLYGASEVNQATEKFKDYIAEQVLADSLAIAETPSGQHTFTPELDGTPVVVSFSKTK